MGDERRRLKGQQGRGDNTRESAGRKGCGEGARGEDNGEEGREKERIDVPPAFQAGLKGISGRLECQKKYGACFASNQERDYQRRVSPIDQIFDFALTDEFLLLLIMSACRRSSWRCGENTLSIICASRFDLQQFWRYSSYNCGM